MGQTDLSAELPVFAGSFALALKCSPRNLFFCSPMHITHKAYDAQAARGLCYGRHSRQEHQADR